MFRTGKIPEYFKYLYQKYTHLLYVSTGAACLLLTNEHAVDFYEYKLIYSLILSGFSLVAVFIHFFLHEQNTLFSLSLVNFHIIFKHSLQIFRKQWVTELVSVCCLVTAKLHFYYDQIKLYLEEIMMMYALYIRPKCLVGFLKCQLPEAIIHGQTCRSTGAYYSDSDPSSLRSCLLLLRAQCRNSNYELYSLQLFVFIIYR